MANPQHLILRRFWLQQKVWGLTETKDIEKMGKTLRAPHHWEKVCFGCKFSFLCIFLRNLLRPN